MHSRRSTHPVSHRAASLRILSIAWLATVGLASHASAQPSPRIVTLEEALELALSTSEQISIAEAGIARAEGEEQRARSERYPQLTGSFSYDRALASEFEGIFDSSSPQPVCDPFVADPNLPLADRVGALERAVECGPSFDLFGGRGEDDGALPFGRENTYRLGLSFSQALYTGGRVGAQIDIAEAGRDAAEIQLASSRAQTALDVVEAYYDAALSDRLVEITEAALRQAEATFERTRLAWQAGSQPEFDVLRAQVAYETQQPEVIRRRSARELAYLRLKQLLELPLQMPIRVSEDLAGESLPPPARFTTVIMQAPAQTPSTLDRAPVRQAESQVRLLEAALEVAEAQRRPSVTFVSQYGRVAYAGVPSWNDFRTNWTVGATVQMPLFTGGRIGGDIAIAGAQVEEARARLHQVRELATLDTQSALEELEAARATWEASAGTVRQAVRAHEIADLRYREGISTQLELSDARLLLEQAQANRAQAARDLQVARVRLALLPNLPLGTGVGQGQPFAPAAPSGQPIDAGAGAGTVRASTTGAGQSISSFSTGARAQ